MTSDRIFKLWKSIYSPLYSSRKWEIKIPFHTIRIRLIFLSRRREKFMGRNLKETSSSQRRIWILQLTITPETQQSRVSLLPFLSFALIKRTNRRCSTRDVNVRARVLASVKHFVSTLWSPSNQPCDYNRYFNSLNHNNSVSVLRKRVWLAGACNNNTANVHTAYISVAPARREHDFRINFAASRESSLTRAFRENDTNLILLKVPVAAESK